MEKYDLYWVKFYYEDDPNEFKIRPGILLNDTEALVTAVKITKHPPRCKTDYQLLDWKKENLSCPSTARLNKIQQVKPLDYIGHLSDRDIKNIESVLGDKI